MQAAFQQAALPEPFKVLGKNLKPYTLGHDILLGLFESGFCRGKKFAASESTGTAIDPFLGPFEDLMISVWICSFDTYAEAICHLQKKLRKKHLKKWAKKCGRFDLGEAYIHFFKYIAAHTEEPAYWVEDHGRGAPSNQPFAQFLKVMLMREFGMKEHEALDTPYAQAYWNYLTILENGGRIRFMSQADEAAVKAANDPELERKLQALAQRMAHN